MDAPARRDDTDGVTYGDNVPGSGLTAEQSVGSAEMRRVFLEQVDEFAQDLAPRETRILHSRLLTR